LRTISCVHWAKMVTVTYSKGHTEKCFDIGNTLAILQKIKVKPITMVTEELNQKDHGNWMKKKTF